MFSDGKTSRYVIVPRLMEEHFQSAPNIGPMATKLRSGRSPADGAPVSRRRFLWMPLDFVKRTILGITGKEQSECRTSASAVVTEAPGPDAGHRERRSPSASPPYI